MAGLTQQEIDILIQLHGEQQVRQALQGLQRQANQTERGMQGLGNRVGDLGDRLGGLPGPLGQVGGGLGSVANGIKSLTGLGGFAGLAIGATALATGMVALGVHFAKNAVSMQQQANQMNVSIERFQALQLIANRTGADLDEYTEALGSLAERMTDAGAGTEGVKQQFAALGLSFEKLKDMSPERQLQEIFKAYNDLGKSQKATAAMSGLLGEQFRQLTPVIEGGEEAVRAATEKNRFYGVSVGEELIEKGKEAKEAQEKLTLAVTGFGQAISGGFSSPFTAFMEGAAAAIQPVTALINKYVELKKAVGIAAGAMAGIGGGALIGGAVGGVGGFLVGGPAGAAGGALLGSRVGATAGSYFGSKAVVDAQKREAEKARKDALNKSDPWTAGMENAPSQKELNAAGDRKKREADQKTEEKRIVTEKKLEEDRKKAASAAEAAAKKAKADAEAKAKFEKDALIDSERRLLVEEDASEARMAQFETEKGRQRDLTDAAKKTIIADAERRDLLKQQAEDTKLMLQYSERLAGTTLNGVRNLREIGKSIRDEAEYKRATKGMGEIDRDAYAQGQDARRVLEENLEAAQDDFNNSDWSIEAYGKLAQAQRTFRDEYAATTEIIRANAQSRKAAEDDWMGGFMSGIVEYKNNMSSMSEQMNQVGKNLFQGMENALTNFVTTGKLEFKDLARSIIADLAAIAIKKAAVGFFGSLFGGGTSASGAAMGGIGDLFGSGGFGGGYYANGGAFSKGTQFFADGGVVNRATAFGMSGGRTGVMGEAGPEAIMPLKRGPNGKLGVVAANGGGGVNITFGNIVVESTGGDKKADEAQGRTILNIVNAQIEEKMRQANRAGGMNNRPSLQV